jgi:hypothetical protein
MKKMVASILIVCCVIGGCAEGNLADDPAFKSFPKEEVEKVIGLEKGVSKSERRDAVLENLRMRAGCRILENYLANVAATGGKGQLSKDSFESETWKEIFFYSLTQAFADGNIDEIRRTYTINCSEGRNSFYPTLPPR